MTETAVADTEAAEPARNGRGRMARGTGVGRYVVLDFLGAGGMGEVYTAYDPELGRKVALKLTASSASESASGRGGRDQREAQAMAQLSHPNVVAVHDVGATEGRLFLAMELVDGGNLRAWLEAERRSWREVLEAFVQAGRGLAAAHAAGVIHRDFKPDNVLMGKGGSVRVTDFGLARPLREVGRDEDRTAADGAAIAAIALEHTGALGAALAVARTTVGTVAGTPAYMAPEQHAGLPVDARADQFAFCVALHEGLFGERPFAGETYAELASNVTRGVLREPAGASKVPGWLRRALARGLATDPATRFASMEALLDVLERGRRARWRHRAALGAIALTGIASVVSMQFGGRSAAATCGGGEERLRGIWDRDRRAAVLAAFARSGAAGAADTFERVAAVTDHYRADLIDLHRSACKATHVTGERSAVTLDRTMECLDRRADEMRASIDLWLKADAATTEQALRVAYAFVPADVCRDPEALAAEVPLPEDPALRRKVIGLRSELDQVNALIKSARLAEARPRATRLVERARAVAHRATLAQALLAHGTLELDAGDGDAAEASLYQAAETAASASDMRTEAVAWVRLLYLIGSLEARAAEGRVVERAAEAAVARVGDEALRAALELNQGNLAATLGELDEAEALTRRSLERLRRILPPDDPELADALHNLGIAQIDRSDFAGAFDSLSRSLAINERALGARHPSLAKSLAQLGQASIGLGRYDEARRFMERGIDVTEQALGRDHPDLVHQLYSLAVFEFAVGDDVRAIGFLDRAQDIVERKLGPEHASMSELLVERGNAALDAGAYDEAIERYERAVAISERALGSSSPAVGDSRLALAAAVVRRDPDRALELARSALALYRGGLGDVHPQVGAAHETVGYVHLRRGELDDAGRSYRSALAIAEASGDDYAQASARFGLGLVAEERGDCATALPLFDDARRWIEGTSGPKLHELESALTKIAGCQVDLARPAEARALIDRAIEINRAHPYDPAMMADADFVLARVLWAEGRDRAQARRTAEKARAAYAGGGAWVDKERREVDRWLASHRGRR